MKYIVVALFLGVCTSASDAAFAMENFKVKTQVEGYAETHSEDLKVPSFKTKTFADKNFCESKPTGIFTWNQKPVKNEQSMLLLKWRFQPTLLGLKSELELGISPDKGRFQRTFRIQISESIKSDLLSGAPKPILYDSFSEVRRQINLKHGKYYAPGIERL